MKELSFEKMEVVKGGDHEMCGFAIGGMIFFSGGWGLLAAGAVLAFCLYGDS